MAKAKDFYGKDIASVIEQACKDLASSQEDLEIEVLETGSAGIFGLCKKKAHIRVRRKAEADGSGNAGAVAVPQVMAKATIPPPQEESEEQAPVAKAKVAVVATPVAAPVLEVEEGNGGEEIDFEEDVPVEPPSAESLESIRSALEELLRLMRFPSRVEAQFERNTVHCSITGEHEQSVIGPEGRTLDSVQYLLRKMVAKDLPEKVILSLNAGDFRERRAEELKILAVQLAEQVKADGKTQAIPALNPSERRVVHVALQEDKGVRSRSVGDGLFKKVLIYKPGKGRRPSSRKRKGGGQGGRSTDD